MFLNEQEITITANVRHLDISGQVVIMKKGTKLKFAELKTDEEGFLYYRFDGIDSYIQAMCVFVPTRELTDEEIINWKK